MHKIKYLRILSSLSLVLFLTFCNFVFASTTDGTIDSSNRYAWSETAGWIDFGTTGGAVHVTDSALSGSAFSENLGWIKLDTVANDGAGNLSGKAWSETSGWIDFKPTNGGVTISSSGVFSGYAYGENIGWINFTTANPVTTDWRPISSRGTTSTVPQGGGNGAPVGLIGSSGGGSSVSQTPSRPQIIYPDGHIVYLDSTTTPNTSLHAGSTSNSSQTNSNSVSNSPQTFSFTRNLSLWSKNNDVKQLQVFLNSHGYLISESGPGSVGQETTLFGSMTLKSLIKFQKDNNIKPSAGYFGPITRGVVNNQ